MSSQTEPREPMRNVDKAWLDMDTPTNLMIINGVMLFDAPIDYARFCRVLEARLANQYRRFRQRIVDRIGPGGVAWEIDPNFDLRSHVRHLALPAPGDIATLQKTVSDLASEAFDSQRPLWRFYLIDNVEGGCAVFGRLHHCIADGIALVQVLLSLTDDQPDAPLHAPAAEPARAPLSAPQPAGGPGKEDVHAAPAQPPRPAGAGFSLGGSLGFMLGAAGQTKRLLKSAASLTLQQGVQTVVNPRHVLEQAYTAGLLSVTGAAILAKLLLLPPDNDSVFKGDLGAHKRVVWSDGLPLDEVKALGRASGATVNDILVTAVAGALRRYMEQHGGAVDMRAMVPVNLRDPNQPLKNLGNEFALVYLSLPLREASARGRLRAVKRQMDMLKQSPEPLLIYEILNVIGMAPGEVAEWATTWFSTKASAVLTNVPGPRARIYLCGQPLQKLMFWVPQTGRIGLGISIISYCGEVSLGIMVDEKLIADPEAILTAFADEMAYLRTLAAGATDNGAGAARTAAPARPPRAVAA